MTLRALLYAYVFGGLTFIPLVIAGLIFFTVYTSVPIGDPDVNKNVKANLEDQEEKREKSPEPEEPAAGAVADVNDIPKTRKGWLTMRRTFEESTNDGSYVTLVRSFLDARSKDPKRSKPKDMWYVVLKGKVLYLYEDEGMTECEAAVELGGHDVVIYPECLLDGELFAKRNAICLKPKIPPVDKATPSSTKEMKLENEDIESKVEDCGGNVKKREKEREKLADGEKRREVVREEALNVITPWFIFVRSNVEMEDWYLALIHASDNPAHSPTLTPLLPIFQPSDMNKLVATLDEQPDVIPMRWLNALIGRIFFSYYRTHALETYIIGRLMKKLSKVKRPAFLTDIVVTEVSVGNKAPTFSKPMLKELTKEGDASLEVHLQYKGEIRITVEATATINLGARFKSYTVKLVLAAVLKELEGNLLVKVKRPPSNRIWYAFTQTPRMVFEVEPIVSDRQITWGMILSTIESRLKEIVSDSYFTDTCEIDVNVVIACFQIQESVVMPNMDDIAFFESLPYQHRGGIWADASRHEKPPSSVSDKYTTDENISTSSAPVLDTPAVPSVEVEPSLLERPHSAEELITDVPPLSPPLNTTIVRAPTTSTDDSPGSTNSNRRSWFSSVRSEDLTSFMERESYPDGPNHVDEQRGRTAELEKSTSFRSQSTPNKPESIRTENSDKENSEDSHIQAYLSPETTRQSSSRRSSIREHLRSTSVDDPPPDPYSTPTTPTFKSPDSNRSVSSTPHSNPPSSPTSFLSTLKSRAGDKQALSNTAKEAMRKWGVNWGGLRKDSSGGNSASEDMPDHGSVASRLHWDNNTSLLQNARSSYAEVRAAVAERKGRERDFNTDDGLDVRSSSPIAITEGSKGKGRAISQPSVLFPTGSSPSSFPGGLSISPSKSSSGKQSSIEIGVTSKFSSPSVSRTNTEMPSSEGQEPIVPDGSTTPPSPIHVQPQRKTMTIPGIHASHRGDVMSMGYVAPHPPPPSPSESKLKNPAIQTVYRLWKSPATSGQQQQQPHQESSSQAPTQNGSTEGISPPSLPPDVQTSPTPPPRPTPPSLPPRSTPTPAVSRPPIEAPRLSSDSSQATASEALKSIASKDEHTRTRVSLERNISPTLAAETNDLDSENFLNSPSTGTIQNSNPAPPLPPRRIEASA